MSYDTLASNESLTTVAAGLRERNIEPIVVANKEEAMQKIKELIPAGASVMNGASTTLEQLGFVDYLKAGAHGWENLHGNIVTETDPVQQQLLRRQALISDFYLGSVHALAETGEFVVASNTGSQMPHVVFSSPNVIFVVSTKKIVPTLADAQKRLEAHVIPLEDKRMMSAYNAHTRLSKEIIFHYESPFTGRKIYMLLVQEDLGF
jgi:L-lactate utilization protein LutC